jgi:microcystin-dependent protein
VSEFGLRETAGPAVGPRDDRPLTEQEYRLVQRLFSDPFAFPVDFKQWLVSFLESSDMTLPISSVNGLVSLLGLQTGTGGGSGILGLLPAGLLLPSASPKAITGTLLCNGLAVSRVTYQRLFDQIGTRWGTGDGSTTFNVPDFRRRMLVGALNDTEIAGNEGLTDPNARSPQHRHTSIYQNPHAHGTWREVQAQGTSLGNNLNLVGTASSDGPATVANNANITQVGNGNPVDTPAFAYTYVLITTAQ